MAGAIVPNKNEWRISRKISEIAEKNQETLEQNIAPKNVCKMIETTFCKDKINIIIIPN